MIVAIQLANDPFKPGNSRLTFCDVAFGHTKWRLDYHIILSQVGPCYAYRQAGADSMPKEPRARSAPPT